MATCVESDLDVIPISHDQIRCAVPIKIAYRGEGGSANGTRNGVDLNAETISTKSKCAIAVSKRNAEEVKRGIWTASTAGVKLPITVKVGGYYV